MSKKSSDSNLESFVTKLDETHKVELLKESRSSVSFSGNSVEIREEKRIEKTPNTKSIFSRLLRLTFIALVITCSIFALLFIVGAIENNNALSFDYLIRNSGLLNFFENFLHGKGANSAAGNY